MRPAGPTPALLSSLVLHAARRISPSSSCYRPSFDLFAIFHRPLLSAVDYPNDDVFPRTSPLKRRRNKITLAQRPSREEKWPRSE